MDCREMDWITPSGSTSSGFATEAAEHIAVCERCRRLAAVLGHRQPPSPLSGDRVKRIEGMLLRDLAPVSPLSPEPVHLSALALLFLAAVGVGSVLLGTDGWRVLGTVQKLTVFLPVVLCAGAMARSLLRVIVPGSRHTISPVCLPLCVFSLLAVVFVSLFRWQLQPDFVPTGLGCLRIGFAGAVPMAALLGLFLRRGAILSPGLTGATMGGLAGLASLAVLEIRCPNLSAPHILAWHLGVTGIAVAAGLMLGRVSNRRMQRSVLLANQRPPSVTSDKRYDSIGSAPAREPEHG